MEEDNVDSRRHKLTLHFSHYFKPEFTLSPNVGEKGQRRWADLDQLRKLAW